MLVTKTAYWKLPSNYRFLTAVLIFNTLHFPSDLDLHINALICGCYVACNCLLSFKKDCSLLRQVNDTSMENVLHEHAVATLKAAKDCVALVVVKTNNDISPVHLSTTGVSTGM